MFYKSFGQPVSHIAVLGNALPRQCGLATYTSHSVEALRATFPELVVDHYAMDDGHGAIYGPGVKMTIGEGDIPAYIRAASAMERSGAELVWIHHEFGIFGGPAGDHLLTLLRHLSIPVVVTLHTVLARPDAEQYRVMRALIKAADGLIVMAQEAARLLETVYDADPARIRIIPHGAPDRPFSPTLPFKEKLGLGAGPTVLTFGLLSPGKGIEIAIRALPEVVQDHPALHYYIVGATHPALVRAEGEHYRETLTTLARTLGVADHVVFVDRFLGNEELLDYLQATDIYLTPYLGREQVTSGTLAYALAMGKPVVSTPYIHAEEALANGVGTLVPFGDADAISEALHDHLRDPARLEALSRAVWDSARSTIWDENARAVMDLISEAKSNMPVTIKDRRPPRAEQQVQLAGIAAMTDDVGITQHSIHGVPDRRHGYCIDDNARALRLICETRAGDPVERQRLARIYAAFVEHAWNEETGRFRNFMGYDRCWLETEGSEDSNGRTLWALGCVMRSASQPALRRWANGLFNKALPLVDEMTSPRAIAFSMLGMAAVLEVEPGHQRCRELLTSSAAQFSILLAQAQRPGWAWFEIVLAYDNARLPQAMIAAGRVLGDKVATSVGLSTLAWLLDKQRAPAGHFRPVGSDSFGRAYAEPEPFDQQPLEAEATIDACAAAHAADGDARWIEAAHRAFTWFSGENDLQLPLTCEDGTLCFDGLTPQGVNLNLGAESILALQAARQAMAQFTGTLDETPQLMVVQ
ncbi:glycosyltransferase family 4 protein [Sphingobium nicotianae]|uniref:Glycosyltransferase family 4 protein n=1 Tax=Sphingobium nicotianae TaxID=2782607 RepID=A0A9X1DA48_9SPHN|nr:glycosyltransferase family 4 protein [Sphingobium nicotianae]MBT2186155.1 glycosyltransferase family 4 protein [Sphingobium nicotianae]